MKTIGSDIEQLSNSIEKYTVYLEKSCKRVATNQAVDSPFRNISDGLNFRFLPECQGNLRSNLKDLYDAINNVENYQVVAVEEYCPSEPSTKYYFMKTLKECGLPCQTAMLTYTPGNNVGNCSFIWKVTTTGDVGFAECLSIIEEIKQDLPVYHTRKMKAEMLNKIGRLTKSIKPAVIRYIYTSLKSFKLINVFILYS